MPEQRGIYLSKAELNKAFRDLEKISKHMRGNEWRRKVTTNAAQVVAVKARKRAAKADSAHYWYKNRTKGKRRERGSAIADRVRILPGNLKLSIQHLEKLKRTPSAVIGPKIKQRLGNLKNLGRSASNSSGFYAWMSQRVYSGADDFRRDVMEPALIQSTPQIISDVERETAKQTDKIKNRLSVFR